MAKHKEIAYSESGAEIVGIYGQNGSGKTTILDALRLLQILMTGEPLPDSTVEYINNSGESASLTFSFYYTDGFDEYEISYEVCFIATTKANDSESIPTYGRIIKRPSGSINVADAERSIFISSESLYYAPITDGHKSRIRPLLEYNENTDKNGFSPKAFYEKLTSHNNDFADDIMSGRWVAAKERKSFIFGEFLKAWINAAPELEIEREDGDYVKYTDINSLRSNPKFNIISGLFNYARNRFFVISTYNARWDGSPNSYFSLSVRNDDESIRPFSISLLEPSILPEPDFYTVKDYVENINSVLTAIIPGLSMEIKKHGKQFTEEGFAGIKFEIVSVRENRPIPLRYESEGILKIIRILRVLILAYNSPSVLVAVDELDAGVYEYLLGEILKVFAETGKGQFVFTSHNLRPLEVLGKNSIVFTTTNPKNRYITPKYIKSNNNLRDVYLRSIRFGGQDEDLYNETKMHAIRRALRKAGEPAQ